MKGLRGVVFAAMFATSLAVHGSQAGSAASDAAAEGRVARLSTQLRCLVCQNQSLAESNAEVAVDMRREMLRLAQTGQSDEVIVAFLVQRYGDFILYRPPFKPTTALLWIGPLVLVLAAVGALLLVVRRRVNAPKPPSLAQSDRSRIAAAIEQQRETSP